MVTSNSSSLSLIQAINKLVKVSFDKPKEQQAAVSSADILEKDKEIHKLCGGLEK